MSKKSATILIVDDTDANRYALRRFVEGAGYTVIEAATGNGGIEQAQQHRPDLIILDVNLPDIDGFTTCRTLKAEPRTSAIPVVQVSASFVRASEQVKGLEGGADAYLTQPVEPIVLIATIEAVLRARRVQGELREMQTQLRAALEAAGMETFSIDLPGRTIRRFTGAELDEQRPRAPARPLSEFIDSVHGDDRQELTSRIEAAVAGGKRYEAEYRTGSAEVRWRLERGHIITDAVGQPVRLIGVSMDVTERKRLEEALLEADHRKDEFLAMLAHELRNPLAPIRNAARVLDQLQPADTQARSMLRVIHRQVDHMARLVDDLLDVSRITSGKIELKNQAVLLSNVIDSAIETARPLIDARNHELVVTVAETPIGIHGDHARLTQALSNVVSNAAKYTERHGRIEISARQEGDAAVISVKDNGIGIPPSLLPDVFELFMQGDRALDRAQGGLGIGLALVKRLIELHHGTVHAHSAGAGRGSEFIIRLPVDRQAPSAPARASTPASERLCRRILIVDDNRDSADSMVALLRIAGHEVQAAHTGPAAIQLATLFQPDTVFLDIGLPGMSGLEVVRRLRQLPQTATARIIAMTGYGQPEDRQRSTDAGFDQHLVKPLDLMAVEKVLEK